MTEQDTILPETLLAGLKLTRQPFATPENNADYFTHPGIEIILNSIQNLIQKKTTLVVVKGEKGSGKTCLSKQLLALSSKTLKFYALSVDGKLPASQLLLQITPEQYQQSSAEPHTIAFNTAKFLFHTFNTYSHIGIILDDAHKLSRHTLLSLLQFFNAINKEQHGHISLVFLGENTIDQCLQNIDPAIAAADSVYTILQRPLNKQLIPEYLRHRLLRAGASLELLNEKMIRAIQSQSGGLPSKINQQACAQLQQVKHKK